MASTPASGSDAQPAAPMSDADLNVVLEALQRAELPPEQIQQARLQLESQKTKRKNMQDYSRFGIYLPKVLWDRIENPQEDQMTVLDAVVKYLAESLGLRCPNELTQGTLCGLLVRTMSEEERRKYEAPHALRTYFLTCKSRISTRTGKYRKVPVPGNGELMTLLPSDRSQLPAAYQSLGLEFEEPRIVMAGVFHIAREIVYRKNGKALQLQPQLEPKDPVQMMHTFFAGLMAMGNMAAGAAMHPADLAPKAQSPLTLLLTKAQNTTPSPLALPAPPVELTPSQPKVSSVAQPAEIRAIEDEKKPDETQPGVPVTEVQVPDVTQAKQDETAPVTLAESIERLRQAGLKNSPDAQGDAPLVGLKRPASSMSNMKRPACKQGSKMKSSLKVEKSKAKAESSSERKKRILKSVPPKIREKYKGGCSSCRHVAYCTPSCWVKRGYVLEQFLHRQLPIWKFAGEPLTQLEPVEKKEAACELLLETAPTECPSSDTEASSTETLIPGKVQTDVDQKDHIFLALMITNGAALSPEGGFRMLQTWIDAGPLGKEQFLTVAPMVAYKLVLEKVTPFGMVFGRASGKMSEHVFLVRPIGTLKPYSADVVPKEDGSIQVTLTLLSGDIVLEKQWLYKFTDIWGTVYWDLMHRIQKDGLVPKIVVGQHIVEPKDFSSRLTEDLESTSRPPSQKRKKNDDEHAPEGLPPATKARFVQSVLQPSG
eukprot:s2915_g1.t1